VPGVEPASTLINGRTDFVDFSVPLELRHIQESVRAFVDRHLVPLENEVEEAGDIDARVMAGLRQSAVNQGIYGFNISAELGGGGLSALGEVLVGEEIGRTSIPLAEAIGRIPQSLSYCSAEQRDWLLKPILRAEMTACIALTESEAGSDLGAIRTHAKRDRTGWAISGSKQFISNAETSDVILLLAVTEPTADLNKRFTVFIVDHDNPGLHFTHRFKAMGWRGYHISAFSLDECHVDDKRVLGDVDDGFKTMMQSVNRTRLYIAARCVGSAGSLMQMAIKHATSRRTFGNRLCDHEVIQFMLADMDVEIEAARSLVWKAAWKVDHGSPDARIAVSRAKLYATEMAGRAADTTLQIFGGSGYMSDLPVERMYRDLRGYRIGEGSSEMQRIQIARHLLISK
jgi:acyl-CoA dehydrogenase